MLVFIIHPSGRRSGRRGFTLIELLVVIAIIAILAAILFPVFARARMYAIRTQCISNLKQVGMALHMYADDYEDTYPPAMNPGGYWPHGSFHDPNRGFRPLERYVVSPELFYCPMGYRNAKEWWRDRGTSPTDGWYTGYCYWANYIGWGLDKTKVATKPSAYPNTLLASDMILTYPDSTEPFRWNNHTQQDMLGGTLLYNDGHVKWKNFQEMTIFYRERRFGSDVHQDYWW